MPDNLVVNKKYTAFISAVVEQYDSTKAFVQVKKRPFQSSPTT